VSRARNTSHPRIKLRDRSWSEPRFKVSKYHSCSVPYNSQTGGPHGSEGARWLVIISQVFSLNLSARTAFKSILQYMRTLLEGLSPSIVNVSQVFFSSMLHLLGQRSDITCLSRLIKNLKYNLDLG